MIPTTLATSFFFTSSFFLSWSNSGSLSSFLSALASTGGAVNSSSAMFRSVFTSSANGSNASAAIPAFSTFAAPPNRLLPPELEAFDFPAVFWSLPNCFTRSRSSSLLNVSPRKLSAPNMFAALNAPPMMLPKPLVSLFTPKLSFTRPPKADAALSKKLFLFCLSSAITF